MTSITPAQLQAIGRAMQEHGVTHEELLAQFPNRPTTRNEGIQVSKWVEQAPVRRAMEAGTAFQPAPRTNEQASSANPPKPSTPQAPVNLATYRQEPGKKAKAIRYALRDEDGTVKFYRVKPGYKQGVFFVDVQASDDWHPIRNYGTRSAILARIANDPDAALALYGQEIGACGHCNRTLTSKYRLLGIGPVCINK